MTTTKEKQKPKTTETKTKPRSRKKMPKTDRERALKFANVLIKWFTPYAEKIIIAGSIRREKPTVGDIEILMTIKKPVFAEAFQGKGNIKDKFYNYFPHLEKIGKIRIDSQGERGIKFYLLNKKGKDLIGVDLYICLSPAQWGILSIIRTGSAAFSKWFVTVIKPKYKVEDGCLHERLNDNILKWKTHEHPTEKSVFEFLGWDYIEPKDREIDKEKKVPITWVALTPEEIKEKKEEKKAVKPKKENPKPVTENKAEIPPKPSPKKGQVTGKKKDEKKQDTPKQPKNDNPVEIEVIMSPYAMESRMKEAGCKNRKDFEAMLRIDFFLKDEDILKLKIKK